MCIFMKCIYVSECDLVDFSMKYLVSCQRKKNKVKYSNIFPPNTILVNSNEEVH